MDDNAICFATKDGNTITVAPQEFIRRFFLHVLPSGFVKIRHYGLMASSNSTTKLETARKLIEQDKDSKTEQSKERKDGTTREKKDWRQRLKELTGLDLSLCPVCKKGTMKRFLLYRVPNPYNSQRAPPVNGS